MDQLELAMVVSMYVVLLQTLYEQGRQAYGNVDGIITETIFADMLESNEIFLAVSAAALHDYRVCCGLLCYDDELRYWVKPRSTVWFNNFLMQNFDDSRWLALFRMRKGDIASICHTIRPLIQRQNTNYRQAIPVEVKVCCVLFKLAQAANILTCSENFAIGRSSVGRALREVVQAICIKYKNVIQWPRGQKLQTVMTEFHEFCSMPSVHGAIDATHFEISKPRLFPEDYYYYKSSSYTMVAQAVVDCKKKFTDIFVGLPGSVNDSRVLRKSSLYKCAQTRQLFHMAETNHEDGIPPYLLGDKGYPLMSWILTPHRDVGEEHSALEKLYNEKHQRGRSVIENAFGLLKQTWRELHYKSELDVKLLPDVVICCAILHNMVLGGEEGQIEELMRVLASEAHQDFDGAYSRRCSHHVHDPVVCEEYNARLESGEQGGVENRRLVQQYIGSQ